MDGIITALQPSEYFERFARLQTQGPDLFQLRGNGLIIEKLEVAERKTEGGIILADDSRQAIGSVKDKDVVMGLVLLVGSGITAEDGGVERTDIEPGMLIMVPRFAVEYYSTFPGLAGLTKERIARVDASEVKFAFKDIASFEQASRLLNAKN